MCEHQKDFIHGTGTSTDPGHLSGIYQAEYRGVQLGLKLVLEHATPATHVASIVLDNQGVVKDLKSNSSSVSSLDNRHTTFKHLQCILHSHPQLRVVIRWCPGHKGIPGNKTVDKIANSLAKRDLPSTFTNTPNTAAFLSAIKEWRTTQTNTFTDANIKRLGHTPNGKKHLDGLDDLKKHEIAALTQLRSGHIPLNSYLHRFQQITDPSCVCQEGIETVDHFLFVCQRFSQARARYETDIKKQGFNEQRTYRMDKKILSSPSTFKATTTFCNNTWRFANWWTWAKISGKPYPNNLTRPQD